MWSNLLEGRKNPAFLLCQVSINYGVCVFLVLPDCIREVHYSLAVPQHDTGSVVLLSRVKVTDKKEYKKVKTWSFVDLKLVDCHSEGSELDFKFDKQIFKWVAVNSAEKKSFVVNLFKANIR